VCGTLIEEGLDKKNRVEVDTEYVGILQQDLLLQTRGLYAQMILAAEMIGQYRDFVSSRGEEDYMTSADAIKIELANKRIEKYEGLLGHLYKAL